VLQAMMSGQRGGLTHCTGLGPVHSTDVSHDTRLIDPLSATERRSHESMGHALVVRKREWRR
jgi:hypothetical protein